MPHRKCFCGASSPTGSWRASIRSGREGSARTSSEPSATVALEYERKRARRMAKHTLDTPPWTASSRTRKAPPPPLTTPGRGPS